MEEEAVDDLFVIDCSGVHARFAIIGGVNTLLGGYDTIVGFDLGTDKIDLSRGLLNAISGQIKNTTDPDSGDGMTGCLIMEAPLTTI